ncbi:MAG: TonB-dependent receptor, partial [Crocinitomicaceae bacterium]|nr:TonB-dependent receptor [Crocinitomicaceae bacterium]
SSFLRPTYQTQINGVDTTVINDNPYLQVASGYHQFNIIQKVRYKASEKLSLDYGLNISQVSNAPRYDRLTLDKNGDGMLDNAEWYYGPQKWFMNRLGITFVDSTIFYNRLRVNLAHQYYSESRNDRKTNTTNIRRQLENVKAFSLNVDFDKTFGERTSLLYGLEGVVNFIGSEAYREDINTSERTIINSRYPNGSVWQSYGVYANVKHDLNEVWNANVGLRYSLYQINASFDTTLFPFPITETTNSNGALNGSIGLVYNPNGKFQAYTNLSTGFRAPNIDDLGKVFDSEPGSVIVPNVDLKPEYAYNGELGFVWMIASKVKLDGAAYYTHLENALARASFDLNGQDSILYDGELSRVQAVQNVADAQVYGFQGGVEWVIAKGLTFKSKISIQKGKEYSVDSLKYFPKSHVAPTFGRTSLSYKTRQIRLDAYAVYQARLDNKDLPLNDRTDLSYALDENGSAYTPQWYTLNVKASYYFNKHLSATFGIENITNQLYRTAGSGITASGRNFIVAVKATF